MAWSRATNEASWPRSSSSWSARTICSTHGACHWSGADGSSLLCDLPAGDVHLYASKGASFWDSGDFVGTVQETLSGAPDQTLEWNPVLSRGYEIRGRLTYADGAPLPDVFVSAIRG